VQRRALNLPSNRSISSCLSTADIFAKYMQLSASFLSHDPTAIESQVAVDLTLFGISMT